MKIGVAFGVRRTMELDVTSILERVVGGDQQAADDLLPLVYSQLRGMAAKAIAAEKPGQTLSPTGLAHEAYLRLVARPNADRWEGRRHFLGAASQAMRRILIENARKKADRRRIVGVQVPIDVANMPTQGPRMDLIALDEALDRLAKHDAQGAKLVELRYFGGFSHQEAAEILDIPRRSADRLWSLAKA